MKKYIYVPQLNEYCISMKSWNNYLKTVAPTFHRYREICFDFSKCHFLTAEGAAILAGTKLVRDTKGYKTTIAIDTISSNIKIVLDRLGIFELFESREPDWKRVSQSGITTLPIYRRQKLDKNEIATYIDEQILNRTEMPDMSNLLRKEIRKAFFELFNNIFAHSKSSIGGLVCGQVFPKDKKIQIVFYDAGIGIAKNVRNLEPSIKSDEEAIKWSLRRGTSTLSSSSVSRGLGLFLIRMFLRTNEGEFRIYANNGAVTENKASQQSRGLLYPIVGTLIDMRIIIRDDIKYTLFSEDEV